jgi:hypothetical protein
MGIDRQWEGGALREKGFSAADSTFSGIVFALVPLVSRTNRLQISVKQSGKATFDGMPRCRSQIFRFLKRCTQRRHVQVASGEHGQFTEKLVTAVQVG